VNEGSYAIFLQILSSPYPGAPNIALTGEMISMQAELHNLLGRTKGVIPRPLWIYYAEEAREFFETYVGAWSTFLADVSGGVSKHPNPRAELNSSFLRAVDGTRGVLSALRREAGAVGLAVWSGD
jgi:hypothetical protein